MSAFTGCRYGSQNQVLNTPSPSHPPFPAPIAASAECQRGWQPPPGGGKQITCRRPGRGWETSGRLARLLEGALQPGEMIYVALQRDPVLLDVVPLHRAERIVCAVLAKVTEIRPILEV
jgi:hypothetical protein